MWKLKVISVRDETYERLMKVKMLLRTKSFGETIDKLVEIYLDHRRRYLKELVRKSKLDEEEVKKIEESIKEIEERKWW
ncbi:MAG: hypothetical protein J7L91_05965 [Candidatus Korarchaeota archaeon]|nr:hypothetical protein [Candidatus Korarchaeota archaeon]